MILTPTYEPENSMETTEPTPCQCANPCPCSQARTAAVDLPVEIVEGPAIPDNTAEIAEMRRLLDEVLAQVAELQAAVAELMADGLNVDDLMIDAEQI